LVLETAVVEDEAPALHRIVRTAEPGFVAACLAAGRGGPRRARGDRRACGWRRWGPTSGSEARFGPVCWPTSARSRRAAVVRVARLPLS
ncbi:MAG: hypothetical protein RQ751_08680, partial [Longimicrobiales bacterium]|nr:hypothetical protein [Longimicrobiales bacterium]